MYFNDLTALFQIDMLAKIMITLILFLGFIVWKFSGQYLQGDQRYHKFRCLLLLLILSMTVLVSADNLWLFLGGWGISNYILIEMMIHNRNWQAAKTSGILSAKILGFGFFCLLIAFLLLDKSTQQASIHNLTFLLSEKNSLTNIALLFILIAALVQSALWPFHRWLLSSLNSPTPTSAMMHAGLINGGGLLLVRFAHLYSAHSAMLMIIFILGIVSAVIGTFWKLIQNDVKKMLACSTLAQMGFMFVQCGLGLFPAAVAHLCWHSLFKANLFLGFNTMATEKISKSEVTPGIRNLILALIFGAFGSYLFSMTSHISVFSYNTTLVLISVVLVTASQLALTLLQAKKILLAGIMSVGLSALYGFNVKLFEALLGGMHIMQPQPLNIYYFTGIMLFFLTWVFMLFRKKVVRNNIVLTLFARIYVMALNATQSHPATITAQRNQYQYK